MEWSECDLKFGEEQSNVYILLISHRGANLSINMEDKSRMIDLTKIVSCYDVIVYHSSRKSANGEQRTTIPVENGEPMAIRPNNDAKDRLSRRILVYVFAVTSSSYTISVFTVFKPRLECQN